MGRFRRSVLALAFTVVVAVPVMTSVLGTSRAAGAGVPYATVQHDSMVVETLGPSPSGGYATHAADPTEAQGMFVLPTFACTKANQTFDMSIALVGSPNAVAGFFTLSCYGPGAPFDYEEIACADPGICNQLIVTPSPGDTITITVTATTSQDSAVVDDVTTGMVTSQTGNGVKTTSAAEFLDQREFGQIPTFTKVKFIDCTVDGTPISSNDPTSFPMTKSNGTTQVKVGPLNSSGNGFATKFEHH